MSDDDVVLISLARKKGSQSGNPQDEDGVAVPNHTAQQPLLGDNAAGQQEEDDVARMLNDEVSGFGMGAEGGGKGVQGIVQDCKKKRHSRVTRTKRDLQTPRSTMWRIARRVSPPGPLKAKTAKLVGPSTKLA